MVNCPKGMDFLNSYFPPSPPAQTTSSSQQHQEERNRNENDEETPIENRVPQSENHIGRHRRHSSDEDLSPTSVIESASETVPLLVETDNDSDSNEDNHTVTTNSNRTLPTATLNSFQITSQFRCPPMLMPASSSVNTVANTLNSKPRNDSDAKPPSYQSHSQSSSIHPPDTNEQGNSNAPPNSYSSDKNTHSDRAVPPSVVVVTSVSPMSQQYAVLRKVRRHYSESDANSHGARCDIGEIERETDNSRAMAAKCKVITEEEKENDAEGKRDVDDNIQLQVIDLTPKPKHDCDNTGENLNDNSSCFARVQSFDPSLSPAYQSQRNGTDEPKSDFFSFSSAFFSSSSTPHSSNLPSAPASASAALPVARKSTNKGVKKSLESSASSTKHKDKSKDVQEKEATFNFFGIKFRRHSSHHNDSE